MTTPTQPGDSSVKNLTPAELRLVKKAVRNAYERGRAAERREFDGFLHRMRALKELNGSADAFLKAYSPGEKAKGRAVEMEHTADPAEADRIAADHLAEDPAYYSKLDAAGLADGKADDNPHDLVAEAMLAHAEESLTTGADPLPGLDRLRDLLDDPAALAELLGQGGADDATVGKCFRVLKAFTEADHPRGKGGQFIAKDRIEAAKTDPEIAKQLRAEVAPEDAGKLDAALGGKAARRPAEPGRPAAKASNSAHQVSDTLAEFAKYDGSGQAFEEYATPAKDARRNALAALAAAKAGDHALAREYHKDAAAAHEDAADGHDGYSGRDVRHAEAARLHRTAARQHRLAAGPPGADDATIGKCFRVFKAWEESKHPRDHGKFSSAPGGETETSSSIGGGERSRMKIDVPDRYDGEDAFDVPVIKNPTTEDIRVKAKNLRSRTPIKGLVAGDDVYVWWAEDVHHQPVHEALDLPGSSAFENRIIIYYDRESDTVSVDTHSPNAAVSKWAKANGFVYQPDTKTAKAVRKSVGWGERLYVLKAWNEADHPRGKNGHFISKDRIDAAKTDPKLAKELRKEVKPEDAGKLDAALESKTDLGRTKRGQAKHEAAQRRATKDEAKAKTQEFLKHFQKVGDLKADLTADHLYDLAEHLKSEHVTIDDVRQLRTALHGAGGGKASFGGQRKRQALVDALRDHARGRGLKERAKELGLDGGELSAAVGTRDAGEPAAPAAGERTPLATTGQYGAWGRAAATAPDLAPPAPPAATPPAPPSGGVDADMAALENAHKLLTAADDLSSRATAGSGGHQDAADAYDAAANAYTAMAATMADENRPFGPSPELANDYRNQAYDLARKRDFHRGRLANAAPAQKDAKAPADDAAVKKRADEILAADRKKGTKSRYKGPAARGLAEQEARRQLGTQATAAPAPTTPATTVDTPPGADYSSGTPATGTGGTQGGVEVETTTVKTPASEAQTKLLASLAAKPDVRFDASVPVEQTIAARRFIRDRLPAAVGAAAGDREQASRLIDAIKAGASNPRQLLAALGWSKDAAAEHMPSAKPPTVEELTSLGWGAQHAAAYVAKNGGTSAAGGTPGGGKVGTTTTKPAANVPAGHTPVHEFGGGVVTAKDPKTGALTTHFPPGVPEKAAEQLHADIAAEAADAVMFGDGTATVAEVVNAVQSRTGADRGTVLAALRHMIDTRVLQVGTMLEGKHVVALEKGRGSPLALPGAKGLDDGFLWDKRGSPLVSMWLPRPGMSADDVVAEYRKNNPPGGRKA